MNAFTRILVFCLGLLLFTFNTSLSQNNLSVKLTESSVLLDEVVVCGDPDFQKVLIGIDGTSTAIRTNIIATLTLFDGISLDELDVNASSVGVSLLDNSTPSKPVFSLPTLDVTNLSEVMLAFTVRADCGVVNAINANNELQIFDTWTIDYQIEGASFSESYNGVEYKNALAIPNLTLATQAIGASVRLGTPFQRAVRVINSGLNSYLEEFVYKARPEDGLVYQNLRVNGRSIPFTRALDSNGDSVVLATIDNSFFFNNSAEVGSTADGDGRFDVDEVVTITETLLLTDCGMNAGGNLTTDHEVGWGCGGTTCQLENTTSTINLGIGEEQIQFTVGQDSIAPGFCTEGTASLVISNNGFEFDDGFGAILDVAVGIGFSSGERFTLYEQGYQITSLQIGDAIVFFPDTVTSLNGNDIFLEDPDGEGGLEDVDADGYFDDLAVGQSFTVRVTYQVDCSASSTFDLATECTNDFRGNFDGRVLYTNPCGTTSALSFDNFLRSFNTGSTKEICADTDALNDGDEFTIIYTGERRRSNFGTCDGADEIKTTLTLPLGIGVAASTFLQQDSITVTPRIEQNGEEWTLNYLATDLNLNNDYELHLIFTTECTSTGFVAFPIQIEYFCEACDCGQLWYCGVLEGTLLHAAGPPCSESVCDIGIAVTDFQVERTTFGYTDETFTTRFDAAIANKEVALTCDSVLMSAMLSIGTANLSDSIDLVISYGNADESEVGTPSFLFDRGDISIIDLAGNITKCSINSDQLTTDTSNSVKQLYFDLSVCLEGRTLVAGEKIDFKGYFAVNPDAPAPTNTFKKVPNLRAKVAATVDGVVYDNCESYGDFFRLAKLEAKFSGPNNESYPEGCAPSTMVYSLDKSINGNAMRTFFGAEHRQAAKINQLQLNYDPTLLAAFSGLTLEYRTQEQDWQPLPDFSQFAAGTYQIDFGNDAPVSDMLGSNQLFQLRINAIPECASAFSSSDGTAAYAISTELQYENRYYANFIDTGTCVDQQSTVQDRTILYQNPPTFSLTGIQQDITTGANEAQWIIEHCNTSFNADAGISWIALEVPSNDITISAIEILRPSGRSEAVSFQQYGTAGNKVFAITPGLSRNIAGNTSEEICNIYRITAALNLCGTNSITAQVGWSCAAFEETDWTPDLYAPCEAKSIDLSVTTLTPFLSADYLAESSSISGFLCDTSTIDIIVRNEEQGRVYAVNSQITLPFGTRLVPGSVAFAYPSTAAYVPITTDPVFVEERAGLGNVYEYADFSLLNSDLQENGLQGFNVNAPDSSEFKIRYRLVSDCNFHNGSTNRYRFRGAAGCGRLSNTAFAETTPFIFKIDPAVARNFSVKLASQEPLQSEAISTIELEVTNIGKNPSTVDSISLTLPSTISYVPNSTLALALLDWDLNEPSLVSNDSIHQIRFPLPVGLSSLESITLSFQVSTAAIDCSQEVIADISTVSTMDFFCPVSGGNCLLDFTSSDSSQFVIACATIDPCVDFNSNIVDTLLAPSCNAAVNYCLPNISIGQLIDFTLTDNGVLLDASALRTCNVQQTCIYSYGNIFQETGPIQIISWIVDGQEYSGEVANIAALVDSMNIWDPTGNWVLKETTLTIEGGHEGGGYSQMDVLLPASNFRSILGYDTRSVPEGISINLATGSHELVIGNSEGCSDTLQLVVLEEEGCATPICTPATVQDRVVEKSICNQATGSITVNVSGVLSDYTFEWSPDGGTIGNTPNIRTDLFVGGYQVRISNRADATCFVDQFIIVENEDGPKATIETTPSACNIGTGSATLVPTNFNYNWSDGGSGAFRENLRSGSYYVTLTDPTAPDCPNVQLVEIATNEDLVAMLVVDEYANCNETNGAVHIDVSGGSGNYDFSFPSGTNAQDGLSNGTYQVTITDKEFGCQLPYTFILESRETQESITILEAAAVSCVGVNNGFVRFDIQYSNEFLLPADTIITDGKNDFENNRLAAGDYFVYIKDVTGCITASAPFTITQSAPRDVLVSKSTDCDAPAFINVEVADINTPLFYDWADIPGPTNEANRTDLLGGTYELTIYDEANCATNLSVTTPICCIPPTITDVIPTTAACEEATGSITILLNENITDYTYTYEPNEGVQGASPNIRENLSAGGYEVTIAYKGDTTCSETILILIEEEVCCIPPTIVDATSTIAACGESTGSITVILDENVNDYTYTYEPNEGVQGASVNIRENLPTGGYQITMAYKGDTTCSETVVVFVEEEVCCVLPTIDDAISTIAACGEATGSITIRAADGVNVTDYTYSYVPNVGVPGTSPNIQENLPAGGYEITIAYKGDSLCSETMIVFVEEEICCTPPTEVDVLPTIAACGEATGSITISLAENVNDYTYSYEPNEGEQGASINVRENLPAGGYQVTIAYKGDPNCSETVVVLVEEEDCCILPTITNVASSAAACEEANGSVTILLEENIDNYTYTYLTNAGVEGANPNIRENLPAGSYQVKITSKADTTCSDTIVALVEAGACCVLPTVEEATQTPATCGEPNGSVTITLTENVNDYTYSYLPDEGVQGATPNIRENLPTGGYQVTVAYKDDITCSETVVIFVEEGECCVPPTVLDISPFAASCGEADGSITITLEQNIRDYTFNYQPNLGTPGITPDIQESLPAGSYDITITYKEDTTCTETRTILLEEEICCIPASLETIVPTPATCRSNDGRIEILLAQDVNDYTFTYTPNEGQQGATPNIQDNLPAGDYEVAVAYRGDTNCIVSILATVEEETCCIPARSENIVTTNAACGVNNGSIEVVLTQDIADYTFSYTPNEGQEGATPNIRENLPPGDYSIAVVYKGDSTCIVSILATVGEDDFTNQITPSIMPAACGVANGAVALVIDGAAVAHTVTYEPDEGIVGDQSTTQLNLPAGEYTITVSMEGSTECMQTLDITIPEDRLNPMVTDTTINAATCGEENGQVEIIVEGPVENYSYTYEPDVGAVGSAANIRQDLPGGEYLITVAVEGSDRCTETITLVVPNNDVGIIVTDTTITPADCGTNNGMIDIAVLGDPEKYTYTYEPNEGADGERPNIRERLPPGDYAVTVSLEGKADCSQVINFSIETTNITDLVSDTNVSMATCGNEDGTVEFVVNYDLSDYVFIYEPNVGTQGDALNIRENLPAGDYTVNLTYKNNINCSQLIVFTIQGESIGEVVTDTQITPSDCGLANGTVFFDVVGAVEDYTYTWEEGAGAVGNAANVRTDLSSGAYRVTIANVANANCFQEIAIDVPLGNTTNSPVLRDSVRNPSCGETNGEVFLTLASDIENYTIKWLPNIGTFGTTRNIRKDLPGGDYQIVITDKRDSVCMSTLNLNLINRMPSATTINTPPSCNETADGAIRLSPDQFRYTWSDGFIGSERTDLLANTYSITITDTTATNICEDSMMVELTAENTLIATAIINSEPTCEGNDGDVRISTIGGSGNYSYSWESTDSLHTRLSPGIHQVIVTDNRTGCTSTTDFALRDANLEGLCTACALKVGRDTIVVQTNDCTEVLSVCLDYTIDNNNPLSINIDGIAIPASQADACQFDSIGIYTYASLAGQGALGPYEVTAWQVNDSIFTGSFTTITDLVDSMNVWDPSGQWRISDEGLFIVGTINNTSYQPMEVVAVNIGATATLGFDDRTDATGIATTVGLGLHEIIITDPESFCTDSIVVVAACIESDTIPIRILSDQADTLCFSTEELVGEIASTTVGCLQNDIVEIEVYSDTCVIIRGQQAGTDTACVILCDVFGVCDTSFIPIQINLTDFEDTLLVNDVGEVCIDANSLGLDEIETIRAVGDTMTNISYEVDPITGCITYMADMLGTDTTLFEFCDEMGLCDTIPIIVNVFNSSPDTIVDTVFINQTVLYCFDSEIFPGEINFFENTCLDASREAVDFYLDPLTYCVEYTGVELGKDSACVVLCDNLGNCDSAFFSIQVDEFLDFPTAVDDLDTTRIGSPVVLDIIANDLPYGVPDDGIFLVEESLYGEVNLNLDGSITYVSDEFCERSDQFTYSICNAVGCDTATVTVWIECIDIVVFSAVSPNRDGINDVFYISGIEEFPESRLQIYNRWGERVYDVNGYDNDWEGTWKGNRELPDGAYFYCLELNDEEKRVFQGFLEIHR